MPVALIVIAAVVVVALAARYAPGAAQARTRDRVVAECAQLTAQLASVRQAGGDVGQAAQLQAQLDACVQRANALGAGLDASAAKLVQADAAYAQIEAEFLNLRATNYADWLKRQNTLSTMHRIGGDLARIYDDALSSAESPASVARVRASILRSIDAAIQRRNCYATRASGCDRSGPAELTAEEKADAEMVRVIRPLSDAYRRAAAQFYQLGGKSADRSAGSDTYGVRDFGSTLLPDCDRMADFVRSKFAEYQSIDYADSTRRNNVRADLIAWERALVGCLRGALDAAIYDRSEIGLGAVIRSAGKAREDSIARLTCFSAGSSGCGRQWGVFVEPDGAEKARAENEAATGPLAAIINDAIAARSAVAAGRASIAGYVVAGARGRVNIGRIG